MKLLRKNCGSSNILTDAIHTSSSQQTRAKRKKKNKKKGKRKKQEKDQTYTSTLNPSHFADYRNSS